MQRDASCEGFRREVLQAVLHEIQSSEDEQLSYKIMIYVFPNTDLLRNVLERKLRQPIN